jgi:hypothetical protein
MRNYFAAIPDQNLPQGGDFRPVSGIERVGRSPEGARVGGANCWRFDRHFAVKRHFLKM